MQLCNAYFHPISSKLDQQLLVTIRQINKATGAAENKNGCFGHFYCLDDNDLHAAVMSLQPECFLERNPTHQTKIGFSAYQKVTFLSAVRATLTATQSISLEETADNFVAFRER